MPATTTVSVREETHKRLKEHHQGPGDTMDGVVSRALDALEETASG